MTQLTTQKDATNALQRTLSSDAMQRQLAAACANTIKPERLARIAMTELRRTPKLAMCSQESFLGALMECAQLGLEPGGSLGFAYLIPYGKEVQFQVGYKGLLSLLWRSPDVIGVQSEVVREKDAFSYGLGTNQHLEHVPASGERGEPTHVYCVIEIAKGAGRSGWIVRVMTADEIENHREQYSATKKDSGPWATAWDEMACKTVIKRTVKRAPVSAEVQRAIGLDDMAEARASQGLAANIEVGAPEPTDDEPEVDPETGEVIPDDVGGGG